MPVSVTQMLSLSVAKLLLKGSVMLHSQCNSLKAVQQDTVQLQVEMKQSQTHVQPDQLPCAFSRQQQQQQYIHIVSQTVTYGGLIGA